MKKNNQEEKQSEKDKKHFSKLIDRERFKFCVNRKN